MRKFPHTYVIVFYILLISAILTWIIPGGEYVEKDVLVDGVEKTEMVYREVEKDPQSWQVSNARFMAFFSMPNSSSLISGLHNLSNPLY